MNLVEDLTFIPDGLLKNKKRIYLGSVFYFLLSNYLSRRTVNFKFNTMSNVSLAKFVNLIRLNLLKNYQLVIKKFKKPIYFENILWKKQHFDSVGYQAQKHSIVGRMLYQLSYVGSTQLFSQNLFTPHSATDIPCTNY